MPLRIPGVRTRKPLVRAVLATIAITAGGLASGNVTAAAAATGVSSWPAQVVRPVAATCPAGDTLIAPTGGWTDALGVSHITYRSRPGMVDVIAPRRLTANRVTPALLADLGLRVGGGAKAGYQARVKQALVMARTRTAPEFCYSPRPVTPLAAAKPGLGYRMASTVVYSPLGTWGGTGVTEAQSGSGINGAEGQWVQPQSYFNGSDNHLSEESTWVGVGDLGDIGASVAGLIQTGTQMETGMGYVAFYEVVGTSGGCAPPRFCGNYSATNAVRPGQLVSGQVYWTNTTHACFINVNETTGTTLFDLCTALNIPYDHTSAEWVNESDIPGGYQYANPHTVTFTDQSYSHSFGQFGGVSPFSTAFDAVIMGIKVAASGTPINCSNPTILSYPTGASSSGAYGSSQIITCPIPGIDE
jgi:hypothetical protein